MSGYDDLFGPRVDPRYRRALDRQKAARKPPTPPFACTPDDLCATGDEGHLGLLVVLADSGWVLHERRVASHVVLTAENGDRSYVYSVDGATQEDRAVTLFKALYSDEPDAIACAADFWPPPPAPSAIGAVR